MLFLFCVALQFTLRGASCLVLPCSLSMCFVYPFSFFYHLAWGRGSWSLCLSCICLLAVHTLFSVTFSLLPGVGGRLRLLLVALPGHFCLPFYFVRRGARWLSGRVSDSGARGPGFETYRRRVVSLSKTLYSPKVLVNYPGSDGSVPI